jgi:hypothetical protein
MNSTALRHVTATLLDYLLKRTPIIAYLSCPVLYRNGRSPTMMALSSSGTRLARLLRRAPAAVVTKPTTIVQQRGQLHLAPPFLLDDDYIPRYRLLSEADAERKREEAYAHLRNCNLCPRLCGVNRYETTGMCLIGENVKVNVIAPHFGEGRSAPSPSLRLPYHRRMFPLSTVAVFVCLK